MRRILAIDAGGTSSRAALIDLSGNCLGYGRATGGNPTAVGIDAAVTAICLAAERACAGNASVTESGSFALVSLAGHRSPGFVDRLSGQFAALGIDEAPIIEPDLLGTYFSGTAARDGYALIAGTGAIAARVADGRLETVRGGNGWLLGDDGSGFWIGHAVVRAAVADLDRLGPATALTALVLDSLAFETTTEVDGGRPEALNRLTHTLYEMRPVELARFAPLAFDVGARDEVAYNILSAAGSALAETLAAVIDLEADGRPAGAVVLGGSILAAGFLRFPAIFEGPLGAVVGSADLIPVPDGVVGAAVLALRHAGVDVGDDLHAHLRVGIANSAAGRA